MITIIKAVIGTKGALWIILAVAVAAYGAGIATGRYSSAVTVAHAQVTVAKCGEARAADNSAANATAAQGLSASVTGAAHADDNTARRGAVRADGYAKAQEGANHALPAVPAAVSVCPRGIAAAPLLRLIDGMRDAERDADRAAGAGGDGLSGAP